MDALEDPYGAQPFDCDGRINDRLYRLFMERFIWKLFHVHPCDHTDIYNTTGYHFLRLIFVLICLVFSPWIYGTARRQIASIPTAAPGILYVLRVALVEGLLYGLTTGLPAVSSGWATQLQQFFITRFNALQEHWTPTPAEPPVAPEPVVEAPTAPELIAEAPAAPAEAPAAPAEAPAAPAAAAEPEAGQPAPANPPDANNFPLPGFPAHLAAQQGRTMRDIENSGAGSSSRHAIRPMVVVGQTDQERGLSRLYRFCEKLRDEQIVFEDVLKKILVETRDLDKTNKTLIAVTNADAISKAVKTAVAESTKDLNARIAASVENAVQSPSTSARSETPPKSNGSNADEAKIKSLEATVQQSNATIKSLEAAIRQSNAELNDATSATTRSQQELTTTHEALKKMQDKLNAAQESLVLKDASHEAKQNELNEKLALKATEVDIAKETAMEMEQALEETKSALATTTAELEAASQALDALKESAIRNSASELEATKAANAAFRAQLLESQSREAKSEASSAENVRNPEGANEALRKQVEDLMAQRQESNSALNDGSAQVQHLQNSLELSNQENARLKTNNSALMTEGQALQNQRDKLETRVQAIQEERDDFFKKGLELQDRLSAADQYIKNVHKVSHEQALQINKLQQELNGSRRDSETFGIQTADLQAQLQSVREAGREAVNVAVQERDAKIARLEAELRAKPNSVLATPSTPFSKIQHGQLFTPGPRDKPFTPNAAKAAFAVLEKEKQALNEYIRTLSNQLEHVTRERDVLLEKDESHQMEIASVEKGAQNDSPEFRALDVAKTTAEKEKDELQRKFEIANMVLAAQRSVLNNDQAINPQKERLKRVASFELGKEQGVSKVCRTMGSYETVFPHGHECIETSGEGLLCGIRALVSSMQAQHPNIEPVTFEQLYEMLHDTDYRGLVGQFGPISENNFRADELALMIHLFYGLYDLNVHLGIVQPDQQPMLIPGEDSDRLDRITVWIYNNRAREVAAAKGRNPDAPGNVIYNHYSGLQARQAPEPRLLVSQAPSNGMPRRAAPGSRNIANARGRTARDGCPTKPRMQANNPFATLFKPGPMQTDGTFEED